MINFKTVAILAMTMALCGFSSTAFAQSSNAIHSASLNTASALPTYQAIGTTISTSNVQPKTKRKLRRIVEPLPELATRKAAPKGKFLSRAPYSKAVNGHMDKFVINNGQHKVLTPIYFGKDALKSR